MASAHTEEAVAQDDRRLLPADPAATHSLGSRDWIFAAVLLVAVLAAYQPAWNGGFLWDDAAHVTRPELRSWHGLARIWAEGEMEMELVVDGNIVQIIARGRIGTE